MASSTAVAFEVAGDVPCTLRRVVGRATMSP